MKYKTGFLFLIAIIGNSYVYSQLSWNPKPMAEFRIYNPGTLSCENKLGFSDSSKIANPCNINRDSCDEIIKWTWDFGNGEKSNSRNPIHTYPQNGYFTITLKIITKYGSNDSTTMIIFFSGPKPQFKLLSDTLIESGDTAFFENTNLDPLYNPTWKWNFGDGNVLGSQTRESCNHQYYVLGKYDVYLTEIDNINGTSLRCSAIYPDTAAVIKKKITITVVKPNSFKSHSLSNLSVSPNPANDHIYIKGLTKGDVIIFNLTGKEVLRKDLDSSQSVDISTLKKGTYFIRCTDGSMSWNGRFVKVI